jgi:hypothetical protein
LKIVVDFQQAKGATSMGWIEGERGGDTVKEKKFLVDLEKHTYISEKSHQEIIDFAGLNPGGYDNYLKGWVKSDGTIKIWVETIEDMAFRYWDQIKLCFKILVKQNLTRQEAKTFAIVNRTERFAGVVKDFLLTANKHTFFEDQLGYAVHFYGQPKVAKGSKVVMLVNYKVDAQHFVFAGTHGVVLAPAGAAAKRLRIRWQNSKSGIMKPKGSVELLTDRRIISLA